MNAPISDEQFHELLRTELPRELDADEPPEFVRTSLLRARRIRRRRAGSMIIAGVVLVALAVTGVVAVPRLMGGREHTAPPPIAGTPAPVPTIRIDDTIPQTPSTVPYLDGSTWHRADGTTVQLPTLPSGAGPLVQAPIETTAGLFVEWWDDASMSTASYRIGSGPAVTVPAGLGVGYPYEGGVIFDYEAPQGSARLYRIAADGTAGPVDAPFAADQQLRGTAGGALWSGSESNDAAVERDGKPVPGYVGVAWSDPTADVVALWKKIDSECQTLVRASDLTVIDANVCGTIVAISPDATRVLVSPAKDRYLVIDTASGATLSTITVNPDSKATGDGHSVQARFSDTDHLAFVTDLSDSATAFAVVTVDLATGATARVSDLGAEHRFWLTRSQ